MNLGATASPTALQIDPVSGRMIWTELDSIRSAYWGATEIETIVAADISRPLASWSLAVDWQAEVIFWTEHENPQWGWGPSRIRRCDFSGNEITTMFEFGGELASITHDPFDDRISWSWAFGQIGRLYANGSNPEEIIDDPQLTIATVTIDVPTRKPYWGDSSFHKVQCSNLDGSDAVDVVSTTDGPVRIIVDSPGRFIYWSQGDPRGIYRATLTGGAIQEILSPESVFPYGLALQLPPTWPIPTLSSIMSLALFALVLVGGILILRRRNESRRIAQSQFTALLVICAPTLRSTHSDPVDMVVAEEVFETTISEDSGFVSASGSGGTPVLIWGTTVTVSGAPWIRLWFDEVTLSGSRATSNASFVRITSTFDGEMQTLDAVNFERWRNSSGVFRGDEVAVELLAYPGTESNRVEISLATTGKISLGPTLPGICDSIDNREKSYHLRVGRVRFGAGYPTHPECAYPPWDNFCTVFVTELGLFSAGHCCHQFDCESENLPVPIVEFNVPLSDLDSLIGSADDGIIVPADLEDQYPVDMASIHWKNPYGQGNNNGKDWCFFGAFPNSQTALTPPMAQSRRFTLASPLLFSNGETLRITGTAWTAFLRAPGPTTIMS